VLGRYVESGYGVSMGVLLTFWYRWIGGIERERMIGKIARQKGPRVTMFPEVVAVGGCHIEFVYPQ
jgi:hypothetical protein